MGASPIPLQKERANQLTGQQGISSRLFSPLHFVLRQKLGGDGRGSVYRSKHVTIACDSAEKTARAMKTCFHKHEGGFLHRCQRHHYALRCFLGFSLLFK